MARQVRSLTALRPPTHIHTQLDEVQPAAEPPTRSRLRRSIWLLVRVPRFSSPPLFPEEYARGRLPCFYRRYLEYGRPAAGTLPSCVYARSERARAASQPAPFGIKSRFCKA